jgi:hypothetical protein
VKFALTVASAASFLAFACAPANPNQMGPPPAVVQPEQFGEANQSAPVAAKVMYKPKVDILFVIDNSDSMVKHQENLKKNVDRFVEAFEANKRIDFQIGVTTVWDSRRFGPVVQNFHPLGALYPVQNGSPIVTGAVGQNFVTRAPGYQAILGNTLKIGVVARGTDANDLGGPEFEELFSPVAAAIDGRNVGFVRPDAHLAVVLITDADDVSSMAPSKLASILSQSKQNDSSMFSTYAVLSMSKNCPKDPGNDPAKMPKGYRLNGQIMDFLKDTRGHAYDLCDPQYGSKLAEAGRLIAKNADKEVKIQLDQIPEAGTLKVTFAASGAPVPNQYDPANYTITIQSSAMDGQPDDAQIDVTYTPVDVRRLGTKKTKASIP